MEKKIVESSGNKIAVVSGNEVIITDTQSALDLIMNVNYHDGCNAVVINKENITEDFFELRTGIAGDVLQKFSTYMMRLAIVGDFSVYSSKALRDFIYECNNGNSIFFVPSEKDALGKLTRR